MRRGLSSVNTRIARGARRGWLDQQPARSAGALLLETFVLIAWGVWRAGGLMLVAGPVDRVGQGRRGGRGLGGAAHRLAALAAPVPLRVGRVGVAFAQLRRAPAVAARSRGRARPLMRRSSRPAARQVRVERTGAAPHHAPKPDPSPWFRARDRQDPAGPSRGLAGPVTQTQGNISSTRRPISGTPVAAIVLPRFRTCSRAVGGRGHPRAVRLRQALAPKATTHPTCRGPSRRKIEVRQIVGQRLQTWLCT